MNNQETYFIPTNFTDAGRVFGLFELRNLIEALVLTLPLLLVSLRFLPFSLTVRIVAALIVSVPIGGFGLIGIGDDSLTRWLGSWWRWQKARRQIYYRGEVERK